MRMPLRTHFCLLISIVVWLCLGCVHYGEFRDDYSRKKMSGSAGGDQKESDPALKFCADKVDPKDAPHKSIWCPGEKNNFYLGFVEVDEFGELFDRGQLNRIKSLIQYAKHKSPTGNAVVVTFIHGWKNNASDDSGNVWGFRDALNEIALRLTSERANHPELQKEPVVGIYVGWRGATTNVPVIKDFTFFNRRNAAIRIPGAHLTEILNEVIHETKSCISINSPDDCPANSTDGPGTRSLAVIVGHSFGGMVLERSLTQAVVGDLLKQEAIRKDEQRRHMPVTPYTPATDLIALVNEAAPATEGKQLLDLLKNHQVKISVDGTEVPLFLSITSTGDSATGIFLPIGQSPSKLTKKLRKYGEYAPPDPPQITSQSTYYLHSTAHLPPLFSHLLGRIEDPKIQSALKVAGDNAEQKYCHKFCTLDEHEYCVVRAPGAYNNTAYWVMQMGTEFVPDHSQIFRKQFSELLGTFIVRRMDPNNPGAKPLKVEFPGDQSAEGAKPQDEQKSAPDTCDVRLLGQKSGGTP